MYFVVDTCIKTTFYVNVVRAMIKIVVIFFFNNRKPRRAECVGKT